MIIFHEMLRYPKWHIVTVMIRFNTIAKLMHTKSSHENMCQISCKSNPTSLGFLLSGCEYVHTPYSPQKSHTESSWGSSSVLFIWADYSVQTFSFCDLRCVMTHDTFVIILITSRYKSIMCVGVTVDKWWIYLILYCTCFTVCPSVCRWAVNLSGSELVLCQHSRTSRVIVIATKSM